MRLPTSVAGIAVALGVASLGLACSGSGTSDKSDGGSGGGTGGGGGAGGGSGEGSPITVTLSSTTCFSFETGGTTASPSCTGDLVFLQGLNVDIDSSVQNICQLSGTFTSLSQIPSSYGSCSWVDYVEAMNGISNTGYIVANAAMTHHYKFLVVSDVGSTISFRYSKID